MGFILVTATKLWAQHVVIDPGHGGADTGACRGNAFESKITLQVAQELRSLLSQNPARQVSLTRSKNTMVTLPERVHQADLAHADLLVSIHVNSNPSPHAHGVEIYFQNHLPPDEESQELADTEKNMLDSDSDPTEPSRSNDVSAIIEDLHRQHRMRLSQTLSFSLAQVLQSSNLNIRQAPFYVLARPKAPSVLVELGFISNTQEAELLTNPKYQHSLAEKIAKGIENYWNQTHSSSTKPSNAVLK